MNSKNRFLRYYNSTQSENALYNEGYLDALDSFTEDGHWNNQLERAKNYLIDKMGI